MATPAEQRRLVDHDVHTDELPPLPQRDSRIVASRWIEAPHGIRALGDDIGEEAGYVRRIGRYLLWRAGPAVHADARYGAVPLDELDALVTFRLLPDGTGEGVGADGAVHTRLRTWKLSLLEGAASSEE
jgi:hypothetical protein